MTGVEVTQADREAAALCEESLVAMYGSEAAKRLADHTRSGGRDNSIWAQAFARHRQEARSAALEEAAKVADRNAKWHEEAFRKEMILKHEERQTHFAARHREAEEIATAIRSLSGGGGA